MKFANYRIIGLGVITLVVFPLLGLLIHWLVERNFEILTSAFENGMNPFIQLAIGGIIGTVFGFIAWAFVKSDYMRPVLKKYGQVVKSMKLSVGTIIFLSFCAGVGEEFFFRGVVQDYLGVLITAVIFVLIHGYLNPFDKVIFVYGILMTALITALGFMDIHLGLISAMTAHMMIDVVLFYKLTHTDLIGETTSSVISGVVSVENSL
jgi:membrane protease YdiL (CAAX protease family)